MDEGALKGTDIRSGSRESLFGMLLFAALLLFTALSLAGVGWVVYSKWQIAREEAKKPSIAAITHEEQDTQKKDATADPFEGDMTGTPENQAAIVQPAGKVALPAKDVEISVQNGGAAKGSAGTVAELLKKAGYVKVGTGNTVNNYTGVVIYYAASMEKEAEAVKQILIKNYPGTVTKAAISTNKETSAALLTIIVGK